MRRIILFFLCLFAPGAAALPLLVPSHEAFLAEAMGSDRLLLDRKGLSLQSSRTNFQVRRLTWQPLDNFPALLTRAVTEAEDQRFSSHLGVDARSIARALYMVARGRPVQGASTITMQVADLTDRDVLSGKARIKKGRIGHKIMQILKALALEIRWTKAEILEAYLNLIHLRGEFQGIPAFSQAYFGRAPLALNAGEASVIAAMILSPNQKLERLKERACALHKRLGFPDCSEAEAALRSLQNSAPALTAEAGIAPHAARRLFKESSAPIVRSTLDSALQAEVQSILDKNIAKLKSANVHDSAAIVIDNASGEVLAYVGATKSSESPHVDGILAYRQAGSTLKPFIYGKGIETKLLTAASVLLDEPTAISWGKDVYRPANYSQNFAGPVSLREALASSLNVPSVKAVVILGLHETYRLLQALHFTQLKEPDFYGVSIALGAVEIRLDELANAYRMFANGGVWSPLRFEKSDRMPEATKGERLFSPGAAFILSSILSDANARSIGFGWESPLETPFWTAVKTGTSKDYRDNWCVGFSERYTVAVWTGNFDAQAMKNVSGVTGAGPSWFEIMSYLHKNTPSKAPSMPEGVVEKKIRHEWLSQTRKEFFLAGTEPQNELIEAAPLKRVEFVFPADGSILVRDPHQDPEHFALFIRFKGTVPDGARLVLDKKILGAAVSPFKITELKAGRHELAVLGADNTELARVKFELKGH